MKGSEEDDFTHYEIEYNSITERYEASFDPSKTSQPALGVVILIAELTDTSPLNLPKLHSAIDADCLNTLVSEAKDCGSDFEATFSYAGYHATIECSGKIWAEPIEDAKEEHDGESDR